MNQKGSFKAVLEVGFEIFGLALEGEQMSGRTRLVLIVFDDGKSGCPRKRATGWYFDKLLALEEAWAVTWKMDL